MNEEEYGSPSSESSIFTKDHYSQLRKALLGDEDTPQLDLDWLVSEIVRGYGVVYVGAGASASSGYKLWGDLIKSLLEKAKPILLADVYDWAIDKMNTGQYLLVAELLERKLGKKNLADIIFQEYGKPLKRPTPIDIEIGRIPFSCAVTTNYDPLLENAKGFAATSTWQTPNVLLKLLRADLQKRGKLVFKVHGDAFDPSSIVLGTSRYREVVSGSATLRGAQKTLFLTRTVLFVGFGFTDPHVLGILEELIKEYGLANVGPHYAIFSPREAPADVQQMLHDVYNIRTLSYHLKTFKSEEGKIEISRLEVSSNGYDYIDLHQDKTKATDSQEQQVVAPENQTDANQESNDLSRNISQGNVHNSVILDKYAQMSTAVKLILNEIGGRVAAQISTTGLNIKPGSKDFSFYQSLRHLLLEMRNTLGARRADFVLYDEKKLELYCWEHSGKTTREIKYKKLKPNSVCWKAFYQCERDNIINIPNIDSAVHLQEEDNQEDELNPLRPESLIKDKAIEKRYGKIDYITGHTEVKSEMATPVFADGQRIGVLNVESGQYNAFSPHHEKAFLEFADLCGALWAAADSMQRRGRVLDAFAPDKHVARNNNIVSFHSADKTKLQDSRHLLKELADCLTLQHLPASSDRKSSQKAEPDQEPASSATQPPALSKSCQLLLYKADYIEGRLSGIASTVGPKSDLTGNSNLAKRPPRAGKKDDPLVSFNFSDTRSFAVRVFREKKLHYFPKAAVAAERDDGLGLEKKNCARFEIEGEILGLPLMVRQVCVGVLVLWWPSNEAMLNSYQVESLKRIVHCIFNQISSDEQQDVPNKNKISKKITALAKILEELNKFATSQEVAQKIDLKKYAWGQQCSTISDLGYFWRTRRYMKSDRGGFKLEMANVLQPKEPNANSRPYKWEEDKSVEKDIDISIPGKTQEDKMRHDPYLEHLYVRINTDPYTRRQPADLFPETLEIKTKLGKTGNCEWYTTPLITYPLKKIENIEDIAQNQEKKWKGFGYEKTGILREYREDFGIDENKRLVGYLVADNDVLVNDEWRENDSCKDKVKCKDKLTKNFKAFTLKPRTPDFYLDRKAGDGTLKPKDDSDARHLLDILALYLANKLSDSP